MPTSPEYYQKNKERILEYTKRKYQENKEKYLEYQRVYRKLKRTELTAKTRDKRLARLVSAIEHLGGKCSRCHQVFDPVCYDFHHVNPANKDFTIGESMLLSQEKLNREVDKCVLLCSNCHRLVHKELRNAN